MPNWVYNGLTIEGNPDSVNKLVEQMNKPFKDFIEPVGDLAFNNNVRLYPNPVFAFRNIIAPTDLETYKEQPKRSKLDINDPNWWSDTMKVSSTDDSWYNWNNRNWGCKWDASSVELVVDEENGENWVLVYKFDTPWAPPVPAMEKLSEQYPTQIGRAHV